MTNTARMTGWVRGGQLLLIALLLGGCLQTRQVEPPGKQGSDWIFATDYQILLSNLQTSIATGNTQNYLRCISQGAYDYEPASSLVNQNENIWQKWSIQDEQAWFSNMLSDQASATGHGLLLQQTDLQDVSADSLTYVGNYLLTLNLKDSILPSEFTGQIQLLLRLNAFNEWEIRRWRDVEIATDSSWSLLKLRFVQ